MYIITCTCVHTLGVTIHLIMASLLNQLAYALSEEIPALTCVPSITVFYIIIGNDSASHPVGHSFHPLSQPGVTQPGFAQPGVAQPGIAQLGVMQPGVPQPGVIQPHDTLQYMVAELTIDNLGDVLEVVWEARGKWYNIGLKLDISVGTLDSISKANNQDPDDCLTAMIKDWLRNGKLKPSWAKLTEALKSPMVGYAQLAEKLPS